MISYTIVTFICCCMLFVTIYYDEILPTLRRHHFLAKFLSLQTCPFRTLCRKCLQKCTLVARAVPTPMQPVEYVGIRGPFLPFCWGTFVLDGLRSLGYMCMYLQRITWDVSSPFLSRPFTLSLKYLM